MLLIMMILMFSVRIFVVENKREKYDVVRVMGVEIDVQNEISVINNIFAMLSILDIWVIMFRGPPIYNNWIYDK